MGSDKDLAGKPDKASAGEHAEVFTGVQSSCCGDLWVLFKKTGSNLEVSTVWGQWSQVGLKDPLPPSILSSC